MSRICRHSWRVSRVIWPLVCRRLESRPNINATELFDELRAQYPGRFHRGQLNAVLDGLCIQTGSPARGSLSAPSSSFPVKWLGDLPNPKLHVQPSCGDHIDKCVETEFVDLAAQQVVEARLCDAEALGGLRLRHA